MSYLLGFLGRFDCLGMVFGVLGGILLCLVFVGLIDLACLLCFRRLIVVKLLGIWLGGVVL